MNKIKRILYTPIGRIFISIILGLGIATLFHKVCNEPGCITFHGPILQDVNDKVFRTDNKCYKYTPHAETCNTNEKKVIPMEYISRENTKQYDSIEFERATPVSVTDVQKLAEIDKDDGGGWSFSSIITSFMGNSQ